MPKDGTITASSVIEAIPGDENKDPQPNTSHNSSRKRRKSTERHSKPKSSHLDTDAPPTVSSLKIIPDSTLELIVANEFGLFLAICA